MRSSNCADSNRHTPFPWFPRVPFVRSRRREAGRARDYPRGSRVSTGRAPSSPSSTFIVRYAVPHGQHLRFSFSMISPSKFAEERAPRLSAMGGRAGCNPDNPLKLPTKSRLLAARGSKMPNFAPPDRTEQSQSQLLKHLFSLLKSRSSESFTQTGRGPIRCRALRVGRNEQGKERLP